MRSFTDTKGRTWHVVITIPALKSAKLNDLLTPPGFARPALDPVALVDALYPLVKGDSGVTLDDFSESISGDVITAALDALLGAIRDFVPSHVKDNVDRVREAIKRAEDAYTSQLEKLADALTAALAAQG